MPLLSAFLESFKRYLVSMTVIFWPRLNSTWIMLPMLDQNRYFQVLLPSHFRNIFFEKIPFYRYKYFNTAVFSLHSKISHSHETMWKGKGRTYMSNLKYAYWLNSIEQICKRWAIKIANVLSNSRWCLPQLSWAASKFSKMLFGVQFWIYIFQLGETHVMTIVCHQ